VYSSLGLLFLGLSRQYAKVFSKVGCRSDSVRLKQGLTKWRFLVKSFARSQQAYNLLSPVLVN